MSFQDLADGRARELRPYSRPPADEATNKLIQSVFKLQTDVTRLKADVDRLGGPTDTVEHRQKIAAANARIKTHAKQLGECFKQQALDKGSFQMQKILNNFQSVLGDFEATMKIAHTREASSLPKPAPHIAVNIDADARRDGDGAETQALLQAQQRQEFRRVDEELQYNEVLIEERDEAIQEISQQIGEVHEIFQDLATLVNDQSGMVDDIADHIGRTADRTQAAQREVVRAERHQRSARNRQCLVLVIAAVALAVLLLVILS